MIVLNPRPLSEVQAEKTQEGQEVIELMQLIAMVQAEHEAQLMEMMDLLAESTGGGEE